jgi:hypothetical protein
VIALQSDMTRVIAFKTSRDASSRQFPDSQAPGKAFHGTSHFGAASAGNHANLDAFNAMNLHFVEQLAYFAKRLKETQDGDSNLLEKTVIMYGSPMGDPNLHNHRRCPLLVLGHGNGKLSGNMHIKAPEETPMANAFVSLAHTMGMNDITYFGDSNGTLPLHV